MKDLLVIDPPNIIPQHTLLGSLCVASYLETRGFSVDIANLNMLFYKHNTGRKAVDVHNLNLNALKNVLSQYKYIGISLSFYTHQTDYSIYICKWIRDNLPGVKTIVGGSSAPFPTEKTVELFSLTDYYICGEGEFPLELILSGAERSKIPNLATIFQLGEVKVQDPYVHDIETLPFLNYNQISWKGYCNDHVVDVFASKGCAWSKCTFCSFGSTKYSEFRRKSKDRIKEELVYYKQKDPELHSIIFVDEFLTLQLLHDCSEMFLETEEIRNCIWHCCIRADTRYTDELLQKLRQSGLRSVSVGVESLNQDTLNMLKKGTTIASIHHTVEIFRKYGLRVDVLAMYELPMQTGKTVSQDLGDVKLFCMKTGSNLMLSRFILFRGQPIFNEAEKYGLNRVEIEEAMEGCSACYLRNGKPLSFTEWAKTDGEGQKKFVINP